MIDDLTKIMVEVTGRCNAMCPNCSRNIDGVRVDYDTLGPASGWDMPMHIVKKVFTNRILNAVDDIELNGCFGDAPSHPDFKNIVKHIVANAPGYKETRVQVHTNGSIHSTEWWHDLAEITNVPNMSFVVHFAIDGVDQETHSTYRRLTNLQKVFDNAKAFMNNGGETQWEMIEFDYNAHQVTTARSLSKEMGFGKFNVKKGNRNFVYLKNKLENKPVIKAEESKKHKKTNITVEQRPQFKALEKFVAKEFDDKKSIKQNLENYATKTDIVCKWDQPKEKGIFVEYDGVVHRCCYTGDNHRIFPKEWKDKIVSNYGEKFNNLHYHDMQSILAHDYFQKYLPQSFEDPQGSGYQRLTKCIENCGKHRHFLD